MITLAKLAAELSVHVILFLFKLSFCKLVIFSSCFAIFIIIIY